MQKDKVETVKNQLIPRNVRDIRSFNGYINFYRKFIRNYSEIAALFTNLTKKEQPFQQIEKEQEAFDTLKKKVTEELVIYKADPDK